MNAPALPSFEACGVDAIVTQGEMGLTCGERYGPERATCWVARRHPPPPPK